MSDIVERLRGGIIEYDKRWSGDCHSDLGGSADYLKTEQLMEEAAAEIEKLRAALKPFAEMELWTDLYPDGPLSATVTHRFVDPLWIVAARAAAAALKETK